MSNRPLLPAGVPHQPMGWIAGEMSDRLTSALAQLELRIQRIEQEHGSDSAPDILRSRLVAEQRAWLEELATKIKVVCDSRIANTAYGARPQITFDGLAKLRRLCILLLNTATSEDRGMYTWLVEHRGHVSFARTRTNTDAEHTTADQRLAEIQSIIRKNFADLAELVRSHRQFPFQPTPESQSSAIDETDYTRSSIGNLFFPKAGRFAEIVDHYLFLKVAELTRAALDVEHLARQLQLNHICYPQLGALQTPPVNGKGIAYATQLKTQAENLRQQLNATEQAILEQRLMWWPGLKEYCEEHLAYHPHSGPAGIEPATPETQAAWQRVGWRKNVHGVWE